EGRGRDDYGQQQRGQQQLESHPERCPSESKLNHCATNPRSSASISRSLVTRSSPLGVSSSEEIPTIRGSFISLRNGSMPSEPCPISSWRSRCEPNGVLLSLRCRQRSRFIPITRSQTCQTPSKSPTRSYPAL